MPLKYLQSESINYFTNGSATSDSGFNSISLGFQEVPAGFNPLKRKRSYDQLIVQRFEKSKKLINMLNYNNQSFMCDFCSSNSFNYCFLEVTKHFNQTIYSKQNDYLLPKKVNNFI